MDNEIKKILDRKYNINHRVALADKAEQAKLGRKIDYLEAHAFMASMNVPKEWIEIPDDAEIRLEDRSWKPQAMYILHPSTKH